MPAPGTARPFLTGHSLLRGLAAIAVFFAHMEITHLWPGDHSWWTVLYDHLFFWHNEGVDIFFVLSGFILFYVHPPQQNSIWRGYFVARIGKIYPFYLATTLFIAAMFIIGSLRKGEAAFSNLSLPVFLTNLLGIQQWTLSGDNWNSINLPSWSISVELLLYISAYPLLRWLFRSCGIDRRVAFAITAALLACNSCIHFLAPDGSQILTASATSLIRGFTAFTSGAFLYQALYPVEKTRVSAVFFSSAVAIFALTALDIIPKALLPLLALPLLYCISTSNQFLQHRAVEKTAILLGNLSYGIYLLHFPMIKLFRTLTGVWSLDAVQYNVAAPLHTKLAFLLLTIFSTFIGAWVGFNCLETPARKWIRRRFGEKRTPCPTP